MTPPRLLDLKNLPQPDAAATAAARERQGQLTKPPGSLGRLEELGIWLSGWQGTDRPRVERARVIIFAGNHGVTAEGVSPFPADVTVQMVANYRAGGAAINALTRALDLDLDIVPLRLEEPTGNIAREPALTAEAAAEAIAAGRAAVEQALAAANPPDVLVFGEMGIGNTTIAAALSAAVCGGTGADWAGAGTGLDAAGIDRKAAAVDRALSLHRAAATDAASTLCRLGGREQAAIAGAVLAARRARVPVVLDGFVVTAAAAVLTRDAPDALSHCVAGHVSAERAHRNLLAHLKLAPLLDLGMRLGEGTGGALAVPVLRAAAAAQSQMATFAEAAVSNRG
jgi:nicotinate-nucleotide--dimethylbenzimidazole phosphoribosyltransferase